MIRQPISVRLHLILGVVSIATVVVLYLVLSNWQHRVNPDDKTIPNAWQFAEGFQKIVTPNSRGEIWLLQDLWASGLRLLWGVVFGVSLAFVIGIAMGCFYPVEAALLPVVSFFGRIPPTAMLSVYMVLCGLEVYTPMIALGIAPILSQAIFQAVRQDVSEHAIYKAYTLGASPFEIVWEVIVRQIAPRVIEAIRLQIGPAMVFLIAAELLVADVGIGYRIRMQAKILNMNVVYIYLILLGLLGYLLDGLLVRFRRWLCPWFQS